MSMLLMVLLCCAGCAATVPLAPPLLDTSAKYFQPPQDQAHLYVVRTGEYLAKGILFQLIIDGKSLGGIAPSTYHLLVLTPGQHTITTTSNENQASITLIVEVGHNYFVRIVPQWGWVTARVGLETLDNDAGREAVQGASLV